MTACLDERILRPSDGFLRIEYLADVAPHIARLSTARDDCNLLAELPDAAVKTPRGRYQLLGGHRLWHAPEASPRTYVPDQKITIERTVGAIRLSAATEPAAAIAKAIEIRLAADRPRVTVRHELRNNGIWQIESATWALTMFRLTGVAGLPYSPEGQDGSVLAPDRRLIYWP